MKVYLVLTLFLVFSSYVIAQDEFDEGSQPDVEEEEGGDDEAFEDTYQRADHEVRWQKFKIQFHLSFADEKKEKIAKKQFIKNREKIWDHRDNSTDEYMKEVNRFAILSRDQFKNKMMGLQPEKRPALRAWFSKDITRQSVPEEYDSRNTPGAVSFVRAQGNCGGCWAFSTIGTLETCFYMKHGRAFKLSEKHLIDCDGFNSGCEGGVMDAAFNYVMGFGGVNPQKLYPYEDGRGRCRAETNWNRPIAITSVKGFPSPQEEDPAVIENMMKVAVAQYGAVAIGIDAEYMQFYAGGVYSGECTIGINHGVTLIGYGICNKTQQPYWLIKNSWGPRWGEAGYLRLLRGQNYCGVAQMASVPIIADNINFANVKTDEDLDKE